MPAYLIDTPTPYILCLSFLAGTGSMCITVGPSQMLKIGKTILLSAKIADQASHIFRVIFHTPYHYI